MWVSHNKDVGTAHTTRTWARPTQQGRGHGPHSARYWPNLQRWSSHALGLGRTSLGSRRPRPLPSPVVRGAKPRRRWRGCQMPAASSGSSGAGAPFPAPGALDGRARAELARSKLRTWRLRTARQGTVRRTWQMLRGVVALFALALTALEAVAAAGSYPSKSISLIVPFAAGGPTDVVARIISDHMSRTLGQQFVVENIGGAGGTTGMARLAAAEPDGYTLGVGNMGTQSAAPALYPNLKYNPATSF